MNTSSLQVLVVDRFSFRFVSSFNFPSSMEPALQECACVSAIKFVGQNEVYNWVRVVVGDFSVKDIRKCSVSGIRFSMSQGDG